MNSLKKKITNLVLPKNKKQALKHCCCENPCCTQEDHKCLETCATPVKRASLKYRPSCLDIGVAIILLLLLNFFYYVDTYIVNGRWRKEFRFDVNRKHEIWRYFTYSFFHGSSIHLWSNSIGFLIFWIFLVNVHGYLRLIFIYICGVIAGSLAAAVCNSRAIVIGSSGGVYAIIVSWLPDIFWNWSQQRRPLISLLPPFGILIYDAIEHMMNVSIGAHIGGFMAGSVFALAVLKNVGYRSYETIIRCVCIVIIVIFFLILIEFNYHNRSIM